MASPRKGRGADGMEALMVNAWPHPFRAMPVQQQTKAAGGQYYAAFGQDLAFFAGGNPSAE
jgi:hypothetical protein